MKEVSDEFWDTVDINKPTSLRRFFLRYSFFTTHELAMILGKCARTIRAYKIRAGIRRIGEEKPKPTYVSMPTIVDLPEDWNTEEWWRDSYAKYGTKSLSRITGLQRRTVKRRLRRFNIPLDKDRKIRSKHPYCTKEWVEEHYIRQRLTPQECARLAGISHTTFRDWLVLYNIQVRCTHGSSLLDKIGGVRTSTI